MKKTVGISVYPDYQSKNDINKVKEYIKKAYELGYSEVFTSLHLPENRNENENLFLELADYVNNMGMEFSVDISGDVALSILDNKDRLNYIKKAKVTWFRFDCGFKQEEIVDFAKKIDANGLMLNASTISNTELDSFLRIIKKDLPRIKIRGHHNFYPMPGTGLSLDFMKQKSMIFIEKDIEVTACVAADNTPRMPLYKGLPTVEITRNMKSGQAARILFSTGMISSVLIGDTFASDEQLKEVITAKAGRTKTIELEIVTDSAATKEERDLIFKTRHISRPDISAYMIRSESTREMASKGKEINPSFSRPLEYGDVVINNTNAKRYSGELAIQLCNQKSSKMINSVGRIVDHDLWKIYLIQPRGSFKFVEKRKRETIKKNKDIIIRNFEIADSIKLVELWNETLIEDKISIGKFNNNIINDENYDSKLFFVAESRKKIVGFIYGVKRLVPYHKRGLETGRGWIVAFGVKNSFGRQGLGTDLVSKMIWQMTKEGIKEIIIGMYSPHYFMPGIDIVNYTYATKLLKKQGFVIAEPHYSMYKTLFDYSIKEEVIDKKRSLEKLGNSFLKCEGLYDDKLLNFIRTNFSDGWYNYAELLQKQNRLFDNTLICIDSNNQIIGYIQRGMGGNSLRLGPIGVEKSKRDKAIGSILLSLMLFDMSCQGLYLTFFMTTDEKAKAFYERAGFLVHRTFYECKYTAQ